MLHRGISNHGAEKRPAEYMYYTKANVPADLSPFPTVLVKTHITGS